MYSFWRCNYIIKATGDTGRYSFTNEAYSFEGNFRAWKKLESGGAQPCPRAAHAASAIEHNQIVIFSGATGGG